MRNQFCVIVALFVCMYVAVTSGQYYGSQQVPARQAQAQTQGQGQGANAAAWRKWYAQQAQYQKQLAAYNAAVARQQKQSQYRQPGQQAAYSRQTAATSAAAAAAARQSMYNSPAAATAATSSSSSTSYSRYPTQNTQQYSNRQYPQYRQQQQQVPTAQQYTQQQLQQQQRQQYRAPAQTNYYQQQSAQQPQYRQQYPQQGYSQNSYQPAAPVVTPAPTTTPVPGEIEVEYENPTTTTTAAPHLANSQWGQYNQNYASNTNSQYSNPNSNYYYQQPQSQSYGSQPAYNSQQPQYNYNSQQQQQQQQPSQQYNNQYQPTSYDATGYYNQQPSQQQQQQPQYQQPQYGQGSYSNPNPQPQQSPNDPFAGGLQVNGLKPTVFNPEYKSPQQQQTQSNYAPTDNSAYAAMFGDQNPMGQQAYQNPMAPQGKTDFSAKGPNPIQLNQYLAQPTAPKESNSALSTSFDALLGKLLSGTLPMVQAPKPTTTTTTTTPAPEIPLLVSDRLNDFVLGPKSQFRSNRFSEIPTNSARYDSMNPLAAFMGETPPPPTTTTQAPPGRNGDFLAGFIGTNKDMREVKPEVGEHRPHIYFYNHLPASTTPSPNSKQSSSGGGKSASDLSNLNTQDLHSMVQALMKVLALRQGTATQG